MAILAPRFWVLGALSLFLTIPPNRYVRAAEQVWLIETSGSAVLMRRSETASESGVNLGRLVHNAQYAGYDRLVLALVWGERTDSVFQVDFSNTGRPPMRVLDLCHAIATGGSGGKWAAIAEGPNNRMELTVRDLASSRVLAAMDVEGLRSMRAIWVLSLHWVPKSEWLLVTNTTTAGVLLDPTRGTSETVKMPPHLALAFDAERRETYFFVPINSLRSVFRGHLRAKEQDEVLRDAGSEIHNLIHVPETHELHFMGWNYTLWAIGYHCVYSLDTKKLTRRRTFWDVQDVTCLR